MAAESPRQWHTADDLSPVETFTAPHSEPTDPTRDAEQAVREALDHLAQWPQSMNRDAFLADVDALIAAVRAEATTANIDRDEAVILAEYQRGRTQAFAEVRRVVEDMPSDQTDCVPWLDVLAAIDALSSEGK